RCACIVSRRVAQCGCQCPQGHFVRSFWRRDCLHDCSVGYISNRNDNGWTWAKGRHAPTSENGRQKQVRSENLLSPTLGHLATAKFYTKNRDDGSTRQIHCTKH